VSNLPEGSQDVVAGAPAGSNQLVLVYNAASEEEAEVVRATLEAAGIPATIQTPNFHAGTSLLTETVGGDSWSGGIYVPASLVESARALLNTPPPTEAELTAAEEADPTTLEEAENRVKKLHSPY